MIICLSGFVIAGSSPGPAAVAARTDIVNVTGMSCGARYSLHQHQLLQQLGAGAVGAGGVGGAGGGGGGGGPAPPRPALLLRAASSSAESVSTCSASPPPPAQPAGRPLRVRTLYACLGESEGELSFEPNQIITNVAPSAEPGWLRGTLNGKTGLVPDNYVEPLP